MNKGIVVLLMGVVLIVAAIGIFAFSAGNMGNIAKKVSVAPHETKTVYYDFKRGNYTLVMHSSVKVSYKLLNSSGVIIHGENVTQVSELLNNLRGNYTLKIENPTNNTVDVAVVFESQSSLLSLGTQVLASGGVCLVGIIVIIVGIVLALKARKKEEMSNVR